MRVDEKGRLAIPAKFRAQLPDGSQIAMGQDKALIIYTPQQWDRTAERFSSPILTAEERAFSRALYSSATPCEFDSQGRVTLSSEQRKIAGIDPKSMAVVVGTGQRVEIWAEARWDNYSEDVQERFTDITDRMIRGT